MNKHEKEDEKPRGVSVGKAPSVGADPVVEASDKAVADLNLDPIRDQAQVQKDLEKDIAESKDDA